MSIILQEYYFKLTTLIIVTTKNNFFEILKLIFNLPLTEFLVLNNLR